MTKKVEVIAGRTYWINNDKGGLISAKWDGENWLSVPPPKALESEEVKSITTISGSKYNYTVQQGDLLVSYGFDTHKELSQHIMYERSK